jgi:hypothetical protein
MGGAAYNPCGRVGREVPLGHRQPGAPANSLRKPVPEEVRGREKGANRLVHGDNTRMTLIRDAGRKAKNTCMEFLSLHVSFLKEFFIEFTRPLRDVIGSSILYSLYSAFAGDAIESTMPVSSGYFFDIWIFLWIFVILSLLDNMMGIMYDKIAEPDNPIDATPRYIGLFIGVFFWGAAFIDIYARMGGDLGGIIGPALFAGVCALAAMVLRVSLFAKKRKLIVEEDRSPWG